MRERRAALASAGEPLEALAELQQWLTESAATGRPINRLQRAAAESLMGDLPGTALKLAQARHHWSAAAQLPVSEATLRTLEVKQALAAEPGSRVPGQPAAPGGSAQRQSIRRMAKAFPTVQPAGYLLARRALRLQTGDCRPGAVAAAAAPRPGDGRRQADAGCWPCTKRAPATALRLPELKTEPQEIGLSLSSAAALANRAESLHRRLVRCSPGAGRTPQLTKV